MSCTAAGNWSSEAPQCKVVECPNPVVANAKKLSGFIGPYKLNYNVRFECDVGFVMNGSYSVTCNVNGHWDPQLPSCRKGQGNNVAVIVGVIVSILVIAAIAVLVWYFVEKRGKHNPDTHSAHYTTCNE
ncbi:membrane cofactor protein-like isoform 2-T2 [Rhinophrynus dorsalis]